MKTILFIHQSAELYGSDKTLFLLVTSFKEKNINPIVVLPERGPLLDVLESNNIKVIISPVLKISRKMFTLKNILSMPSQISVSIKNIDKATKDTSIDVVYSNTLAVLLGLIYAWKKKLKHIWHVHEIIERPVLAKKIFKKLLSLKTNSKIIFNSKATQKFWSIDLADDSIVVWNGLKKPLTSLSDEDKLKIRKSFNAGPDDIVIALVGRINRFKGQSLMLQAFKELFIKYPYIKLIFVGSTPPNQTIYLDRLIAKVEEYQLKDCVKVIPFQSNIWEIWESIDIAVAPSTEPESFGLVALEAMLCKKPVIASNLGGLKEVVIDQETGIVFDPRDVFNLQEALESLIIDKNKRLVMGQNGYERAITFFTLEKYVSDVERVCRNI